MEKFYSTDISSSSTTTTETDKDFSSTTTNDHSSSSSILLKTNNKKQKKKSKYIIIIIIFFIINIFFIFINLIIFSSSNIQQQEQEQEKGIVHDTYEYQLIKYDDGDDDDERMLINKIVEYDDFTFDEDFYGFEDKKGNNGILVKLDLKENIEEWKICLSDCECFVECNEEIGCGNGKECIEYKCVNNNNNNIKRKETMGEDEMLNSEKERKGVGMVNILVPMGLCVFGVFSTFFFAKNYGDKYFSEKCKKVCPTDSLSSSPVEVEIKRTKEWKMKSSFICNGNCKYHSETVLKMIDIYEPLLSEIQVKQIFEAEGMCSDIVIRDTIIVEEEVNIAKEKFYKIGRLNCMDGIDRIIKGEIVGTVGKIMKDSCWMDKLTIDCKKL